MSDGNISIHLLAGMKVKISPPQNVFLGEGYFPYIGTFSFNGSDVTPVKGFWLEHGDIGTLAPVEGELAVIYTHKKSEKNTIWFKAATGELGTVSIVSVPIHDHSSIVQGGPAFGTYFSDDETVT